MTRDNKMARAEKLKLIRRSLANAYPIDFAPRALINILAPLQTTAPKERPDIETKSANKKAPRG